MIGETSIVFTRKAVVDKTFIRDSINWCKTIVGIDASQLYPSSMCQAMPTGLYARWELVSESGKLKRRQNKTTNSESIVLSYFRRVRPQCKVESCCTTATKKKNIASSTNGFCRHCNTVFETMECYYQYCPCQ